jgi:peptidoglycan/LPS O-acetylase OafA/YrhL
MTVDVAVTGPVESKTDARPDPIASPRLIDTAPLMALAAALIVNSHLEDYYPKAFLAADGLLGNSLFFLLSGFGVQLSEAKNHRSFFSYYRRRISRLYPALILCVLFFSVIGGDAWQGWSAMPYIRTYLWPTGYAFIACIVPFYAIFYFIARARSIRVYVLVGLVTLVFYLICYIPDALSIPSNAHLAMGGRRGYMHETAYFEVMLLGGVLALAANAKRHLPRAGPGFHFATAAVLVIYFSLKFIMVVQAHFARCYGLLQLLMLFACGGLFISLTSEPVIRFYQSITPLRWLTRFVAGLTLEIYLVHLCLLHYSWLAGIKFPLNLLALMVVTLAASFLLSRIVMPVQQLITGRESRAR